MRTSDRLPLGLLFAFLIAFIWSAYAPRDRLTWVLEVAPAVIGVTILLATYRRFRFSNLVYWLLLLHAVILLVGGKYTYAEMPLGNWLRDALHLSRNHYDRLGHFAQGFVPALVAREVLLRTSPLRPGKWLFMLVTGLCLGISAAYELLEWAAAVGTGEAAEAFLAIQGDVWDSQKDMLLALIGAVAAQVFLASVQDRSLRRMAVGPVQPDHHAHT